ncbi:MAG: hypothetical protein DMG06_11895 [Acidobacteria bacterium]|nr:MAG: hypothetical protein DMG06_11895 [Acidobacteriota bacterium]
MSVNGPRDEAPREDNIRAETRRRGEKKLGIEIRESRIDRSLRSCDLRSSILDPRLSLLEKARP